MSSKYWFLARYKTNSFRLAEKNLNNQGFETFLPMSVVTVRKSNRFLTSDQPVFPGYIFVKFNPQKDNWQVINNTYGINKLVCFSGLPQQVPNYVIRELKMRCDTKHNLFTPNQIHPNQTMEFFQGPFTNFVATIDTIQPNDRINLLLDFMGQAVKLNVYEPQLKP